MCPTRGETAAAFEPNGTMCRFSAQSWMIATPREDEQFNPWEASTILGEGCTQRGIGIIGPGLQLSLGLCAIAVIVYKTTAAMAATLRRLDLTASLLPCAFDGDYCLLRERFQL